MTQTRADRSADLTSGPMLQKIILFSIPLAASSILQLLFNAADVVVVGRFSGSTALAAVGSNGSLINLLVNLFVGLSLGANVVAARCFGAKDEHGIQDTVHTAVTLGLTSGVLLAVVGFFAARSLLELMSCPEDVIDLSSLYLKIYFIGMPMNMLYNFSSALLRAVGDTKRPLYCLAAAGIINVVLNLVFVIGFSMSVAGVALATIISETVSACLVTAMLVREKGALHLDLHKLGFHAGTLKQILLIGLPAGLQSTVFSLSNVVIQSAINSFGSTVVAGSSASSNLEGFVYTAMNAFAQAAVTFTSQNMGARKYHNLDRVMRNCLLCAVVTGILLGGGAALAGRQLLHFYSSDEAVIAAGYERLWIICGTYLLCGIMDTLASSLRGLGYSVLPMVVRLLGSCLLRLVWNGASCRKRGRTCRLHNTPSVIAVRCQLPQRGSLISRRSASSPHRPHCIPQRAAAFHRAAALFFLQLLCQQVAVEPTVHFAAGTDGEPAGQGVAQTVGVGRTDRGSQVRDALRQKRQGSFQHAALQAVAPPVRAHHSAVGIGPMGPLGLRHTQKSRIVVRALTAVMESQVRAQPTALPHPDAQAVGDITGDMFQRVGNEPLRVRHGGVHLVLQRIHRRGFVRCAAPQGDRLLCRMAADFVQNKFHDCNALQNKIVLFLRFQYKCRFSKCQFML